RPQQQLKPLDVYPNPTWDEFYLQGVQAFIGQQLTIEDLTGRLIYQGRFSGEPVSTRSLGMTKGCYIVRLTDEKNGTTAVEKLLLQ
ncbi:MAG TPA: T9SS type A sorting domain-containing protein, partial [Chitinophagales bacterium]|nr:T9SS type A sorting domain-containing protein [Chitinophagales bacterium]